MLIRLIVGLSFVALTILLPVLTSVYRDFDMEVPLPANVNGSFYSPDFNCYLDIIRLYSGGEEFGAQFLCRPNAPVEFTVREAGKGALDICRANGGPCIGHYLYLGGMFIRGGAADSTPVNRAGHYMQLFGQKIIMSSQQCLVDIYYSFCIDGVIPVPEKVGGNNWAYLLTVCQEPGIMINKWIEAD